MNALMVLLAATAVFLGAMMVVLIALVVHGRTPPGREGSPGPTSNPSRRSRGRR